MLFKNRNLRMLVPILAVTATAVVVTGCGGDDDESSEPSKVSIEATGTKGDITITAPTEEIQPGAAEIEITNSTDVPDLDGQLVFVAEGEDHSDEEISAELKKAESGQPVADWFQGAGGPGATPPGSTATATQKLEAGTYYILPTAVDDSAALPKFTVTGDDNGADLPEADGTVSAVEYSFSGEGLPSGESKILLENKGGTWHHFLASPLKPDATIEDAKAFLESNGNGGQVPFAGEENGPGSVSSTVLDAGVSQVVDLNLEPGKYAFFCFVSDKQTGGPPHVVKGMVSEVEVTE